MATAAKQRWYKRLVLESLGWILVVAGIAALVLPGPGLLALFAGLALLATQYEWAERRLDPVRRAALKTARDSVSNWWRIATSLLGVLTLISIGVMWGIHPAAPGWWPLADKYWLVGGWGTGGTMIGSALFAAGMLVYSYKNFRQPR